MAQQSWYFASEGGQQQGPYTDDQLHDFIASGAVTADTLVWSAGMTGWQRAAEVQGLMSGASAPPPLGGAMTAGGPVMAGGSASAGSLTPDFSTFGLFGRVLLSVIGTFLIVPAPWVTTMLYRWVIERIKVPRRPNLGFAGQPLDIWYVFVGIGVLIYAGLAGIWWLQYAVMPVNAFLGWMALRWVVSNITSDGQKLPITFEGSPWIYIGWTLLMFVSTITIIGWAWVTSAWIRWICANIAGTRRAVVFNGSGWGVLWRTVVFALSFIVIIPIPWTIRWLANWYISQFAVEPRTS